VIANTENRHDIRMVQPRSSPRLPAKPLEALGVEQGVRRQHFERDTPAQRHLLGLVDDPHASPADFTENPEIAQPFPGGTSVALAGRGRLFEFAGDRAQPLDLHQGGE
jgi:hypothetical protein